MKRSAALTGATAGLLLLTGCAATVNQVPQAGGMTTVTVTVTEGGGGGTDSGEDTAAPAVEISGPCTDPVELAMNDWLGYTADAAVVTYVLEEELGCKVNQTTLKEDIAWQGFANGKVDVVLENWGHPDLVEKYITNEGVAVDAGPTGNIGVIGWWVPPWLAEEHPDILEWENLNKYAENFATSESGGKGQFLAGDPAFVTNDEALVTNLDLNFQVVYAGSEAALIKAFEDAEANKKWVIGYFYDPQWFLAQVALEKVALPVYTEGCDADAALVACDYPEYELNKIISTEFSNSGSPAAAFIKSFTWTNDDQNAVAALLNEGKSQEEAAAEWAADNQDKIDAWLGR